MARFSWFKSATNHKANGRPYIGVYDEVTKSVVCYCESLYEAIECIERLERESGESC